MTNDNWINMQQILKINLFWSKEFFNTITTSFSDHIKMHSYHSICTLLYRFSIKFEHGSVKLTSTCCNFVFNHRLGKRKSGSLPLSSPIETSKKHLGFSLSDILAKNSAEKYWGHKVWQGTPHTSTDKKICTVTCVVSHGTKEKPLNQLIVHGTLYGCYIIHLLLTNKMASGKVYWIMQSCIKSHV